jgi:hypothetical protein
MQSVQPLVSGALRRSEVAHEAAGGVSRETVSGDRASERRLQVLWRVGDLQRYGRTKLPALDFALESLAEPFQELQASADPGT